MSNPAKQAHINFLKKRVVELYTETDMTFAEIAAKLKVTRSRVSGIIYRHNQEV